MGFPSPATDRTEQTLTITHLCGYDGNYRTIETSAGYAIVNIARKPEVGDTVLISFCGRMDFASVQGKHLSHRIGRLLKGMRWIIRWLWVS
jgi:hypothetical protein